MPSFRLIQIRTRRNTRLYNSIALDVISSILIREYNNIFISINKFVKSILYFLFSLPYIRCMFVIICSCYYMYFNHYFYFITIICLDVVSSELSGRVNVKWLEHLRPGFYEKRTSKVYRYSLRHR